MSMKEDLERALEEAKAAFKKWLELSKKQYDEEVASWWDD